MNTQSRDQFHGLQKVSFSDLDLAQFFHTVPDSDETSSPAIQPLNGNGHAKIARVYVSYLIKKIFNIHRQPGFDDSIRACTPSEVKSFFSRLDESLVERHCHELKRIHKHTVETLKKAANGTEIIVRRGLSHDMALLVACAKMNAIKSSQKHFTIFGNLFDFYAIAPTCGFDSGVSLVRRISIDDILLCHQTVNGFHQTDSDLLLINRSARGVVEIGLDQICIDDNFRIPDEAYSIYEASLDKGRIDNASAFQDMYQDLMIAYPRNVRVMSEKPGFYEKLFAQFGAWIDGKRKVSIDSRPIQH